MAQQAEILSGVFPDQTRDEKRRLNREQLRGILSNPPKKENDSNHVRENTAIVKWMKEGQPESLITEKLDGEGSTAVSMAEQIISLEDKYQAKPDRVIIELRDGFIWSPKSITEVYRYSEIEGDIKQAVNSPANKSAH